MRPDQDGYQAWGSSIHFPLIFREDSTVAVWIMEHGGGGWESSKEENNEDAFPSVGAVTVQMGGGGRRKGWMSHTQKRKPAKAGGGADTRSTMATF